MILINGKEIQFDTFPNRETKVIKESILDAINHLAIQKVSFKYETDADLIKLMLLRKFLDNIPGNIFYLTIYYMPYSRMDRSEKGSAFTLKYITEFINDLYFDKVIVIEPHSDVTTALLDKAEAKNVTLSMLTAVMAEINFDKQLDYLFFPDAGAQKRYGNVKDFNQLVGYKKRDFETGKINNLKVVGDYFPLFGTASRKVIIIDDLCSYGGTFMMAAEKLKPLGFGEVYLLVAHTENSIFQGEIFKSDLIKKVFTTNTIIDSKWEYAKFPIKIYSIGDILND